MHCFAINLIFCLFLLQRTELVDSRSRIDLARTRLRRGDSRHTSSLRPQHSFPDVDELVLVVLGEDGELSAEGC